jgi:hypothetical protein
MEGAMMTVAATMTVTVAAEDADTTTETETETEAAVAVTTPNVTTVVTIVITMMIATEKGLARSTTNRATDRTDRAGSGATGTRIAGKETPLVSIGAAASTRMEGEMQSKVEEEEEEKE